MTAASSAAAGSALSRIFILGTGNIGCLVAHSLRSLRNPPPVTLLLHRLESRNAFRKQSQSIRVEREKVATITRGYDYELADRNSLGDLGVEPAGPIRNLIVTTKAHHTVRALGFVRDRLDRDSTVLLLQNGMGTLEEVNEKVFPNVKQRPNMVLGVTSHGAHNTRAFNVVHVGYGKIELGVVPRDFQPDSPISNTPPNVEDLEASTKELVQQLLQCYDLSYALTSYPELLSIQLEKLAVNAVINPLSVMFDCYNGQLLYNYPISRLMRLIIFEVSKVIASMPELDQVISREIRFSPERLERLAVGIAKKTSTNVSSMLQDIRNSRMTEIDYINGYVVNRGAQLGIPCSVNFMLREMVKGKLQVAGMNKKLDVPMEEINES